MIDHGSMVAGHTAASLENMDPARVDGQGDNLARLEGGFLWDPDRQALLTDMSMDILLRAYIAEHVDLRLYNRGATLPNFDVFRTDAQFNIAFLQAELKPYKVQ